MLNYENNFELLVSVILSAQCTDVRVNIVTAKLFKKYPRIADYANADMKELEQDIKSTGFYHNKAKNIQGAAKMILGKFGGKLPKTMQEMLTIPGVARKTANVVLGNAYGIIEGIAVDTHVIRLSQRLRLVDVDKIGGKKPAHVSQTLSSRTSEARSGNYTDDSYRFRAKPASPAGRPGMTVDYYRDASPEKIEKELMQVLPKDQWFKMTYLLIDHGRAICKAQKPECGKCSVSKYCPVARN